MKTKITKELKSRLLHAASNGSIIARDILTELRKNTDVSQIIRGTANYFGTKRKKESYTNYNKIRITFTVCTKNLVHPNFPDKDNPQAPWFPENREEIEVSTFVGYFKNLPEYDSEALAYFGNCICVNSKIHVRLYDKMSDIVEAYTADNYSNIAQTGESSLHGSCMRHEDTARNAADFYHNLAGAKIIVAKDSANNILGRAIFWPQVILSNPEKEIKISVLDRVYFSHTFIINLIYDYAKSQGAHLRKLKNDFDSPQELIVLNVIESFGLSEGTKIEDLHMYIRALASRWYKNGAPYMDTFYNVAVDKEGFILLSNKKIDGHIAECRKTDGLAGRNRHICPHCREIHNNSHDLCEKCYSELYKSTKFGHVMNCKIVTYKNETYPSVLFKRGRPTANFNLYMQVEKLYK
ncbi:hypothetical protein [Dysgonomonas sp. ZJ709]|uniref:hypothetical protein n=1 Tax=Dysgonomonas sp. ZJ709 TaxID=2709797 RepID=UPI0013EA25F0|nr:hypothetical protein [Dysgonomonas sp. ZJ709]